MAKKNNSATKGSTAKRGRGRPKGSKKLNGKELMHLESGTESLAEDESGLVKQVMNPKGATTSKNTATEIPIPETSSTPATEEQPKWGDRAGTELFPKSTESSLGANQPAAFTLTYNPTFLNRMR